MITYCLQRYDFFLIPQKNALQKCVRNFCNAYYFSDLSILSPIISRI